MYVIYCMLCRNVLLSIRARLYQASALSPVYTRRRRQCCDNAAIMLAILFLLKTVGVT